MKTNLSFNISSDGTILYAVNCSTYEDITIPYGIKHISGRCFEGCTAKKVIVPDTVETLGDRAFEHSNIFEIILSNNIDIIPFNAFGYCYNLNKVVLPASLKKISTCAFSNCVNLTKIILPNGLEEIGPSAFEKCYSLTKLNFPSSLNILRNHVFNECKSLEEVIINENLKKIESGTFAYCPSLNYLYIPQNVEYISEAAFIGSNIYIEVSPQNFNYKSIDGNLINLFDKTLLSYKISLPVCEFNDDGIIENLGWGLFDSNGLIKEINISIPITSLDNISNCCNLENLKLPDTLKKFGGVYSCPKLKCIELPKSLISIGRISMCGKLEYIKLPLNITELTYNAFSGCTSLKSISLNENLQIIRQSAFQDCVSLKYITIPESVRIIGYDAFKNCSSLEEVSIQSNDIEISYTAFIGCNNLKKINFQSFDEIYLFSLLKDCPNLEIITYKQDCCTKNFDIVKYKNNFRDNLALHALLYSHYGLDVVKINGDITNISSYLYFDEKELEKFGIYKEKSLSLKAKIINKESLNNENWTDATGIGISLNNSKWIELGVYNINPTDFETVLSTILECLNLPQDYPWVIFGGWNNEDEIRLLLDGNDNIIPSFSSVLNEFLDTHIRIRRNGYLILPPSVCPGYQYKFRYNTLPSICPSAIKIESLDDVFNVLCNKFTFKMYKYNDKEFPLCFVTKFYIPNKSFLSYKVEEKFYDIDWLKNNDNSYSCNNLALMLLSNNGNTNHIYELLNKSKSPFTLFNLASLMSVGYFKGSYEEVIAYVRRIEIDMLLNKSCSLDDGTIKYISKEQLDDYIKLIIHNSLQ